MRDDRITLAPKLPKVAVSLRVPGELLQQLDQAANRLNRERSELIVRAVEEFLKRLEIQEHVDSAG